MSVYTPPPVERVRASLPLGDRVVDLATRALVVSVVPSPTWARENEVIAAVRAAADAGADLAEVPADPRLLGPSAQAGHLPLAARVTTAPAARAARRAGASLLVVPAEYLADVTAATAAQEGPAGRMPDPLTDSPLAVLVPDAHAARRARAAQTPVAGQDEQIVELDTLHRKGVDLVTETSLALAFGARVVRTNDIRMTRRVIEVMATLLEARR
jgi:hypothetical protein